MDNKVDFPKEPKQTGWITIGGNAIIMPTDEVVDAKIMAFSSDDESSLESSIIVRLVKKTPTIEFVCANEEEAQQLYEFLMSSKKVVPINFKERKINE